MTEKNANFYPYYSPGLSYALDTWIGSTKDTGALWNYLQFAIYFVVIFKIYTSLTICITSKVT